MFTRIKNLVSQIGLVWKYGGTIRSVTTALANYPGLDDPDELRLWIRPLLVDASSLALLTNTQVDDLVVYAAIQVIDNNHSWTAIHAMALLIHDGQLAVGSQMELPLRYTVFPKYGTLPLVAGVDERNNVERCIEAEGDRDPTASWFDVMRQVADETMPGCPSAVMAAIGVILFLLQSRIKKG